MATPKRDAANEYLNNYFFGEKPKPKCGHCKKVDVRIKDELCKKCVKLLFPTS